MQVFGRDLILGSTRGIATIDQIDQKHDLRSIMQVSRRDLTLTRIRGIAVQKTARDLALSSIRGIAATPGRAQKPITIWRSVASVE